jgi:hypothetical protein
MQTCGHAHTHTCAHMWTDVHLCCARAHARAQANISMDGLMHAHKHTHAHTLNTRVYNTCTNTKMCVHALTRGRCMHPYMHMYPHMHAHRYTRTHIHTIHTTDHTHPHTSSHTQFRMCKRKVTCTHIHTCALACIQALRGSALNCIRTHYCSAMPRTNTVKQGSHLKPVGFNPANLTFQKCAVHVWVGGRALTCRSVSVVAGRLAG